MSTVFKCLLLFQIVLSFHFVLGREQSQQKVPTNNEINKPRECVNDEIIVSSSPAGKSEYLLQEHTVTTEDKYILKVFSFTNNHCEKLKEPPVLLVHGLILSSDVWLDATNKSLAYLLANDCYDLWLGNIRGNNYGRAHETLNPDSDKEFWNFSYSEMGFYDIPATIDYIRKMRNTAKLNYIGYSQGAGAFVIMCSEKPKYCDDVNIFIALSPAVRMKNTRSVMIRFISEYISVCFEILSKLGIHEVFSKGSIVQKSLDFFCRKENELFDQICYGVISLFDSNDPGSIRVETLTKLFQHAPAGTSTKNFKHFAQNYKSETFRKFDYGKKENIVIYGSEQPPEYQIKNVKPPTVIIYGLNDYVVDYKDMIWLTKKIPNVLEFKIVDNPKWNHFDIAYSQYSFKFMYPTVSKYLKRYSLT